MSAPRWTEEQFAADLARKAAETTVTLPLKLESLANKREHWTTRAYRAKRQRAVASTAFSAVGPTLRPPLTITISRLGPRRLDSDNLAISAKHVRDGVADALGIDDGSDLLRWEYDQETAPKYAVRIRVESRGRGCSMSTTIREQIMERMRWGLTMAIRR